MRATLTAFLALSFLSCPATAAIPSGPPKTGTLIPGHDAPEMFRSLQTRDADMVPRQVLTSPNAVSAAHLLARCSVRHDAAAAKAFALSGLTRIEYAQKSILKPMSECFDGELYTGSQLKLSAYQLKGFIAEALISKSDLSKVPLEQGSTKPPSWIAEDPDSSAINETAACVVARDEDDVKKLLAAVPDQGSEASMFGDLAPIIKGCIDPHSTFRSSTVAMKIALSLAFLHHYHRYL